MKRKETSNPNFCENSEANASGDSDELQKEWLRLKARQLLEEGMLDREESLYSNALDCYNTAYDIYKQL